MRHATLFALALFVGVTGVACDTGVSTPPGLVVPTVSKYTTMPSNDELLSEKTIGNTTATNTIYEYVSFSDTASATYHATTEQQIKTRFVNSGQAYIIFRNLFLSSETEAAAMLARCVGNADFFPAVDYIYTTQSRWLPNGDSGIKAVMLGFGMSQSLIDSCLANTTLGTGLAKIHTDALTTTYQLPDGTPATGFKAVPAVVVNGVRLDGTNADGTANAAFAPTVDNIAKLLK